MAIRAIRDGVHGGSDEKVCRVFPAGYSDVGVLEAIGMVFDSSWHVYEVNEVRGELR